MRIRHLTRCPGTPTEWQWSESVDADAPEGATVEEYVETMDDSTCETHEGVYLVRDLAPSEMAALGVEDIRGLYRQGGALVAWVSRDGSVRYELVTEGR
jgi:hypothetical protein